MSRASAQTRALQIAKTLARVYPRAECALHYHSPLQLLIATILSAQCTDVRVNLVTPALFKKYHSAKDFAAADVNELSKLIQSTGFFRNKAKNIQKCCEQIASEHQGEVPQTLDALVKLPGVGRKTANVVLGTAFQIASGVVVDTHVARLSFRLGLTTSKNPVRIEQDLMKLLPQHEWVLFSHRLIHHGRQICKARRPLCDVCPLLALCPQKGAAPSRPTRKPKGG